MSKILTFQKHLLFSAAWPVRVAVSQEAKKREMLEKVECPVLNVSVIKEGNETPFWAFGGLFLEEPFWAYV